MEKHGKEGASESEPDSSAEVNEKSQARRYLFGRPVYTEEELLEMDPFLPSEPAYIAEWERRKALREKR